MARLWKGLPNGQYQPLDGGPAITYVPGPPPPPPTGPTAAFTSTRSQLTASFNASTSTDPSGTITGYSWNFGDSTSGTGKTPSHTYAAAGTYNVTLTVTDTNGATGSVTHSVTVATPPPPPPNGVWWPGLDRCGSGLNAPNATKEADTLARVQQIATAMGKTPAQVKSATMYHTYNSGISWDVSSMGLVQWAKSQGFQGVMVNQKPDISSGASGGLDALFTQYLKDLSALNMNVCVVMQHEPENNGWSQAQATQWCQMTARFLNLTYLHGDPNVIYSTCHIPASAGTPRSWWNARPALVSLVGTAAKAQAIQDASFCGLDPYPGANATLESTCRAALTDFLSWGWTRFSMPEVGLFNWIGKSPGTPGGLTAAQQATRLYNELWVWAKANGFECFNYFDFSSAGDARSQSRTLDTPEEQLQFGKILFNAA